MALVDGPVLLHPGARVLVLRVGKGHVLADVTALGDQRACGGGRQGGQAIGSGRTEWIGP